jgi:predicted ATPase
MGRALARHDGLIARTVERHRGRVFKNVGDGVCSVFPSAREAAHAALEAQRLLAKERWEQVGPLRVRMAIHTGEAVERSGDFFGPTLNRVARLVELANGGQVILSRSAKDQLLGNLPEGAELIDLGVHPLRDLGRPEHIHQLTHPAMGQEFAPLRSKEVTRNNLPAESTSFVGREEDVAELCRRLESSRLVTVTGLGGAGKSRITLRVARSLLPDHKDGAWWVELASLTDGALVAQTVAEALGVGAEGVFATTAPWLDRLADHLEHKNLLIVLDNCEHLIEACAELADTLLRRAPQINILASSREPLSLDGEHVHPLKPLPFPQEKTQSLEALGAVDSIRLFLERATNHAPGYALTADNAAVLARICQKLEGIPLALELAAARLSFLSLEAIAERMDDRLTLLRSSSRGKPTRHRSIRDMLDWSEELLTEPERTLFHRLSVFRGEFPLSAVEAICGSAPLRTQDLADLLEQLVRKSLVRFVEKVGEPKYALLETVREYAEEKRTASHENSLEQLHCDYYVQLVEKAEQELKGDHQTRWLDALDAEANDIRAALDWALRHEDVERSHRAMGALWYFWFIRGHLSEGRRWLERAIALDGPADPAIRAKGLTAAGLLNLLEDPDTARLLLEQSLSLARAAEDSWQTAMALFGLGWQALYAGDLERMRMHLTESRTLFISLEDPWGRAYASTFLGAATGALGDHAGGARLSQEAIDAFVQCGDRLGVAYSQINYGELLRGHGEAERAAALYEEAMAACQDNGDRTGASIAALNLGMVVARLGDPPRARELLKTSLLMLRDGSKVLVPACLSGLAGLARSENALTTAAILFGATEAASEETGVGLQFADLLFYEEQVAALKAALPADSFARFWAQGRSLGLKGGIRFALGEGSPLHLVA